MRPMRSGIFEIRSVSRISFCRRCTTREESVRMKKGWLLSCWAAISTMTVSSGASAQDLAELEARVAQLEAKKEKKGLVVSGSGMDLTLYGYVRAVNRRAKLTP